MPRESRGYIERCRVESNSNWRRSNAIVYLYVGKPETRYAGRIRLSGERTSLSLDHSARNARAGVVPAVFVGIGQLAGCNGAIRSAVPFRCFALRTLSTVRSAAVAARTSPRSDKCAILEG